MDRETTEARFRTHGVRPTRQREAVYAALASTDEHPTAEELFELVREKDPGISLATVYNTLDALVRAGLCRRLVGASCGGKVVCRFDAEMSDHAHILREGGVIDVPHELSAELLKAIPQATVREIERVMGVRIAGLSVQLLAAEKPEEDPDR